MKPTLSPTKLRWCCALAALTAPLSSQAQQAMLEEVIVTAERREESLQDTPIAISAFGQNALDDLQAVNVEGLAESVPTLNVTRTDGNAVQLTLRGITSTNNTELGDPAVSFNVDGIYLARPQAASALMFDVERVEVLRGPQGTLYGRNSTAGAINLISRKPGNDLEGNVGLVAGAYDRFGVRGSVNVPVTDDFALRISGIHEERSSFNTAGPGSRSEISDDETPDTRDETAARISGLWTPRDDFTWLVTADVLNSQGLQPLSVRGLDPDDIRTEDLNIPSYLDQDQVSLRSRMDWDFSESVGLTYLAAYNTLDIDYTFSGRVGAANRIRKSENESSSHELQLKSLNPDAKVEWILGAFWFEENTDNDFRIDISPGFGLRFRQPDRTSEAIALFGQATIALNDTLDLTLGARYSEDEKSDVGGSNQVCPGGVDPVSNCRPTTDNSRDNSWDAPTWRAQLEWTPGDDTLVYGSVSTGYKSGGFGDQGTPDYDEETLISYELGMKSDFLDDTLRLNAALFFSDYDDLQVTAIEGAGDVAAAVTRNAAAAEILGFETEFTWLLTENSRLQGFVSYLDAEFQEFPGGVDTVFDPESVLDLSGNKLAFSPEWSFTVAYDMDFNLNSGASIRPRISVFWADDYYLRAINREPDDVQDSQTIVDASLRYTSPNGSWSLEAFGENLTDEEVKTNGFGGGGGGEGVLDYVYKPPRTWGIRFDYNFGG